MEDTRFHKIKLPKKYIIKNPVYKQIPNKSLKLKDNVLAFFNGIKWHIIPIAVSKEFPIIHEKMNLKSHISRIKNAHDIVQVDVTITFCPFTYIPIIYDGLFDLDGTLYKNNIVLKNINNEKIIQSQGINTENKIIIKKWEVILLTLESAITKFPDSLFIDVELKNNIFVSEDFSFKNCKLSFDNIQPNSIIYGIEYYKKNTNDNDLHYVAVISTSPNKINDYFIKNNTKIRNRNGFIMPCKWGAWCQLFPQTKTIYLK